MQLSTGSASSQTYDLLTSLRAKAHVLLQQAQTSGLQPAAMQQSTARKKQRASGASPRPNCLPHTAVIMVLQSKPHAARQDHDACPLRPASKPCSDISSQTCHSVPSACANSRDTDRRQHVISQPPATLWSTPSCARADPSVFGSQHAAKKLAPALGIKTTCHIANGQCILRQPSERVAKSTHAVELATIRNLHRPNLHAAVRGACQRAGRLLVRRSAIAQLYCRQASPCDAANRGLQCLPTITPPKCQLQ